MPVKKYRQKRVVKSQLVKRQGGKGFWGSLYKGIKNVGKFLRKHKIISSVGKAAGAFGVPYAGEIGTAAGAMGFGKRRRKKGGALSRAGSRRSIIYTGRGIKRAGAGKPKGKTTRTTRRGVKKSVFP